ncbi:MAG: hypothetical protein RLZZ450_1677 [Pseudomonadota bacterium]
MGLELLPLGDGAIESEAGLTPGGPDASSDGTVVALPQLCSGLACVAPGCPDDNSKTDPGVCGCGYSDTADTDGDGTVDCLDLCPGMPDRLESGACACAASGADADGDGVRNCEELCPYDVAKKMPGTCGCGASEADADADGTPDCADECPLDANKRQVGSCGCGVKESDADLDGVPDCVDKCTLGSESSYVADGSCGVGYCRSNNTPSSCVAGKETSCSAAPLQSAIDTCNGVDDDCDGAVDEDFTADTTSCGLGVCARMGRLSCTAAKVNDSCVAGARTAANDATCNNLDDDCDGDVDEDFPAVVTTCGTGACTTMGRSACVNGAVVDSCMASAVPAANDATCNNIDDDCDGQIDEDYVTTASACGVGVCARAGMRTCVRGSVVDSCKAATRTSTTDTVCNGLDDDCDGRPDEEFVATATSCGVGVCRAGGTLTCVSGSTRDSCVAGARTSTTDDAFVPGNGLDDNCDGRVDEDVPACNTTPRTFEAGAYNNVTIPGNCKSVTVRLWGGGGGSGQPVGIAGTRGGPGGPGGYATATAVVSGALNLYVGGGGAGGCNNPGTNAGASTYNGGSGGGGGGANGSDGAVSGGGNGGSPSSGNPGGRGFFGGGGGGQGSGGFGASGTAGGGGAASVFFVNGTRVAVAGGGGGGGGAQATTILGTIASPGGTGGSGCGGVGLVDSSIGGGGGGGGMCQGSSVQTGSGTSAAMSGSIPGGRAAGGSGDCVGGGAGYATLTFAP